MSALHNHIIDEKVSVRRSAQPIPTYKPHPPMDLPMFFEKKPYQGATGKLYPIPFTDSLSEEKKDELYDVVELENDYLKVVVLPQLGGKIFRALDKIGNYDFIYYNSVIKPAMIGLAGPWTSGGIEFNWPQHHRPTTFMPLDADIEIGPDGEKTVWVGEIEPLNRLKGMAGISVCPGRSFIKVKVRLYNRTPYRQPFMWWANLAVPVNDNYSINFPPDVEYVNDHDRRAVIGWPIAKGTYQTARPYDFGDGTNLSSYSAIHVNSSYLVSEGQSDMDFVSGYDHGRKKGIVAFADHRIAPGKKLFHWGVGEFGNMWCSNLTDEDGPYVELMNGVYTDNQPDFSWLMPYETKTFEQYWYPIREIGDVKNATMDAAVNMEQLGSDLFVGIQSTLFAKGCTVRVFDKDDVVWEETADLEPSASFVRRIPMEASWKIADLYVECVDATGKKLVDYKQPVRGVKKPVEPRKPAKRPCEIENNEELFINGFHLEQYKHMTYEASDYYRECLRRDPGDIRANVAMGRLALGNGKFEEAVSYFDRALERLLSRNEHPADVEALYLKGMALKYLGRPDDSRKMFQKAIWHYSYRSAAYYELALLDCADGNFEKALEDLQHSLETDCDNLKAMNLRSAIYRKCVNAEQALLVSSATCEIDKLDLWAWFEKEFALAQLGNGEEAAALRSRIAEVFRSQPEDLLDIACEYMHAGLFSDAAAVLQSCHEDYALIQYYLAYISSKDCNADAISYLHEAEKTEGICFPSRLEDIAILKFAIAQDSGASRAHYGLGCLYYDRFRYDEAISHWEKAISINPGMANVYRNLSIAYFDKRGDARSARICMEKALALKPTDARILYEYQQLLKNANVSNKERFALYEKHYDLMNKRDDCYLDRIVLYCLKGDYATAIQLAKQRTFHIYEGGEGKITRQHAWMHVLYGNELAKTDAVQAEKIYRDGLIIPTSYGEAKSIFAQESHVYFFLAELLEHMERHEEAKAAYKEASVYKAAVSELSLFRALACQRLNQFTQAQEILKEILSAGEDLLNNTDRYTYFGVGSPTPMPFEYDINKINLVEGYVLKGFALLGLGRICEANQMIDEVRKLSPNEFRVYAYDQVLPLLS